MMRNIRGYVEDGWDTKDVIYILTGEDAQRVAREDILRELTRPELEVVYNNLPKEIDWRNVIGKVIEKYIDGKTVIKRRDIG